MRGRFNTFIQLSSPLALPVGCKGRHWSATTCTSPFSFNFQHPRSAHHIPFCPCGSDTLVSFYPSFPFPPSTLPAIVALGSAAVPDLHSTCRRLGTPAQPPTTTAHERRGSAAGGAGAGARPAAERAAAAWGVGVGDSRGATREGQAARLGLALRPSACSGSQPPSRGPCRQPSPGRACPVPSCLLCPAQPLLHPGGRQAGRQQQRRLTGGWVLAGQWMCCVLRQPSAPVDPPACSGP